MTVDIPTLHTARLALRPSVFADFDALERFLASPRAQYMGGPFNRRESWGMFCHDVANWDLFGHGALMLDHKEIGACIGQVCISHGPLFPEKELGWLLYEGFESNGYAAEAAEAMMKWAFGTLKLATLVSYVDPANTRSINVAERLGGVPDPDADKPDPEDIVYRYSAPAAFSLQKRLDFAAMAGNNAS